MKPAFIKAPAQLVAVFASVVPGPPAQERKMFGYPAAFVNGNMFMGLFGEQMFLRLGPKERDELIACAARPFEPMPGRAMAEYVVLPQSVLSNVNELARWVTKAFDYGKSLKRKLAKSTKPPKPSGARKSKSAKRP
jgi:TfoX/Sxy family transcriptional regulator of competence genes